MIRQIAAAAAIGLLVVGQASAADLCFDVRMIKTPSDTQWPLMVNHCTGETWLLFRDLARISHTGF